MIGIQLFSILNLFPLLGSCFIFGINENNRKNISNVSLWITLFSFLLSVVLSGAYLINGAGSLFEGHQILKTFIVRYDFLIDNFSIVFIPIVNFISLASVWFLQKKQTLSGIKKVFISILIFQSFTVSAILVSDIFLLFIFIESTIIPIYIMINSFEKSRNMDAVLNFVIYSILSALLILVGLVMLYYDTGSSNLNEIYAVGSKNEMIFWIMLIGIAVKIPTWPLCFWLPVVHVKSSTSCSVLLSSIVLKFSSILLIRIIVPVFNNFLIEYCDILLIFFVLSIFFSIAQAIFQDDLKKIFAYCSIVHMNMAAILLVCQASIMTFVYSIISHSLVIAYSFFMADTLKSLVKTRSISELQNINSFSKEIKILFLAGILLLIGCPGSCCFISESLCCFALANVSVIYLAILCFLILCLSVFLFQVYTTVFVRNSEVTLTNNLKLQKGKILYFILGMIFILGVLPKLILEIANK